MHTMSTILIAALALGGDPASKSLDAVVPFVDDMTFLVGRVDVTRVSVDDVARLVEKLTGQQATDKFADLSRVREKLLELGAKELFLMVNIADGPGNNFLIVVPATAANHKSIVALLKEGEGPKLTLDATPERVLAGEEKVVARALARFNKKAKAPALDKAFAAVEGSATQWALLAPRPFLRAQEELVPNLPKELGGGPITVVTKGFQWAALGVDIAPKLKLKAIVQATDDTAAAQLLRLVEVVLAYASGAAERDAPMFVKALPVLMPKQEGDRLVLALDDKTLQSVLTPAVAQTRAAAARAQSSNNLKQIGLALHSYHDVYKSFPPHASYAKKKPLLSWRVHILPFVEGDALYRQFKLDEPWDSPHNKALIDQMPEVYKSPVATNVAKGKTVYLVPVGQELMWGSPKGMPIAKITDGSSNTIMTVEADAARAVYWTQPEDLKVDKNDPLAGLVGQNSKGFYVGWADGSVRFMSSRTIPEVLWSMFTVAGMEPIPEKQERD